MPYTESVSDFATPLRNAHIDSPGVSWGAVLAGALVTAAFSLILLALGAGFGLSSVSPWSGVGVSASAAGSIAIAWIVITEVVACTFGGYVTGRLRTRWNMIHSDEVHFRDTANGLLAWAVAVVLTVAFLGPAASSMAGNVVVGNGTPADVTSSDYFVDRLFRSEHPGTGDDTAIRGEAKRILALAIVKSDPAGTDTNYLSQLVASRTGLNPSDASKRVSDTLTDARLAADSVRTATARILLWIFVALLLGAFCASLAATLGGFQRDHVQLA